MSGPKAWEYRVVESAEQVRRREEARALAAARERLGRVRQRWAELALRAERAHVDAQPPVVGQPASAAEAERAIARVEQAAQLLQSRLAEVQRARTAEAIGALHVAGRGAQAAREAYLEALRALSVRSEAPSEPAGDVAASAARVVARLSEEAADDVRDQAVRLVEAVSRAASPAAADLAMLQLRGLVQRANEAAEARVQRSRDLEALRARLDGGDGELVDAARARLEAASHDDQPLEAVRRLTEQAVASMEAQEQARVRRSQRVRVARALRESLAQLGYAVQDEFETALAMGTSGYAQPEGWTDHAVRLIVDPERGQFRVHAVRAPGPHLSSAEDVRREEELCADVPDLEELLAGRGVELRSVSRLPPGSVPVRVEQLQRLRFERADTRPRQAREERAR